MGSVTSPKNQTILISGGSGFIASHIVKTFLDEGYKVRTTVRSESTKEKVERIQKKHPSLSYIIVPDGQAPGAYDEAVKGVDGVIHTASPFVMSVEDNERDLLNPAIKGTSGILNSIKSNNPSIKRVVITSSFAAIVDIPKGARPGYTYTEKDFNPVTYETAKSADGATAYCASKTFAEKAAWEFLEKEKPNFSIATINPPMVYGPNVPDSVHDLSKLNTSSADVYRLINGSEKEVPDTAFFAWVDVRDVAKAHLRAFEVPEAAGQRYFTVGGNFTYADICDIIKKQFPQLKSKVPSEGKAAPAEYYKVSNEKARKELGIEFLPLEKSIHDMVEEFLVIEKQLAEKK